MRRRTFIAGLGSAAAWPLAARAQPAERVRRVGVLMPFDENPAIEAAFRQDLGEQGYIEGRNVQILFRYAQNRYDRLPALAEELVRLRVAVIVAAGVAGAALAAKAATATIPIVFAVPNDPVKLGLVASLNRPGGNVTGVTIRATELNAKRLELLHNIAPAATSVGFLMNPTAADFEAQVREAELAAHVLGVRLTILNASSPEEIEAAFASLASRGIGAVMYGGDPFFVIQAGQLISLAARNAVPAIYLTPGEVEAGGLMSLGASIPDAVRIASTYVGRILNGENPTDLPVQQSTRIKTVLNLKVAKALGLEVPRLMLLYADEVIQ
jgi:putative tryptophan/tyrosine transport system substrate-binding protein